MITILWDFEWPIIKKETFFKQIKKKVLIQISFWHDAHTYIYYHYD